MVELLSQMWSLLGLLTVLQNILPGQLLSLLHSLWESLQDTLTPYSYFDVPEFLGSAAVNPNDLYRHVHLYLHDRLLLHPPSPPPRLTLTSSPPSLSLSPNHSLHDSFAGHRLLWTHHSETLHESLEERRSFSLRIPKRHSPALISPYLSHLSAAAKTIAISSRDRRIFTNSSSSWSSVAFRHPATFQTLALNPTLRSFLLSDLDAFSAGREFYARVGRPWKRGYLLHGPPGSGKSSLIAAMANHLQYDVYDLELTRVLHNSALKSLLLQTTPRSLIVIEDIDCSLRIAGERRSKKRRATEEGEEGEERVTLSGLLNFTDGLWSCCGEEKIIVFTTNYKGGVDGALVRPGRMDVHVQLGACGEHAMREMVARYADGEAGEGEEEMMEEVERCVRSGAGMTAAEVGEVLLRNRERREVAVEELVAELKSRVGGGSEEEEVWVEEEDVVGEGREKKRRGRKSNGWGGWERRVQFLGRLGNLTKSDSGRRGA